MEELEVLLAKLFRYLELWQRVLQNVYKLEFDPHRCREARQHFVLLVTPMAHQLATSFRMLAWKNLKHEGEVFCSKKYGGDHYTMEKHRCPGNELERDKGKVQSEFGGVDLQLEPIQEEVKDWLGSDSDVPELIPVTILTEEDQEHFDLVEVFRRISVTFF